VDTTFFRPDPARQAEPFFLIVSALVPYKRLDVAIRASAATGSSLTIVGRGPEEGRLRALAAGTGARVEFRGWLEDDAVRDLYQRCLAVLMPGVEDFGMVPVEAQACGCPVVALAEGGAVESVVDGATGILVRDSSVAAFAEALRLVPGRTFDRPAIRLHAEGFSKSRFQLQFQSVVADVCEMSGGSNAARFEQRPPNGTVRASENRTASDDRREMSGRRSPDPADRSNAARFEQRPPNGAVRENKQ
jgi:glycosyltransferase involved in cell wall biosynthesis